jgi:hypothetical protein
MGGRNDQAKVLRMLEYLVDRRRDEWKRPHFDLLHGPAKGLGEIILKKIGGVQTRLIGFFDQQRSIFNVVLVVTKKQSQFDPRDWIYTSHSRKKDILINPEKANDWSP